MAANFEERLRTAILSHDVAKAREAVDELFFESRTQLLLPGFEAPETRDNDTANRQLFTILKSVARTLGLQASLLVTDFRSLSRLERRC